LFTSKKVSSSNATQDDVGAAAVCSVSAVVGGRGGGQWGGVGEGERDGDGDNGGIGGRGGGEDGEDGDGDNGGIEVPVFSKSRCTESAIAAAMPSKISGSEGA
jgi:hypothetical protein